jgi:hypothetical protein
MKITKILRLLFFCGTFVFSSWVQAAQGDGTGGGGGDGVTPGPTAPPGAQDAPGPGLGIGPIEMTEAKMDALFDWAENTYPDLFPNHQTSKMIEGYYARYYPLTNIYLGAKDKQVFAYGAPFGGLLNAGTFKALVHSSGI